MLHFLLVQVRKGRWGLILSSEAVHVGFCLPQMFSVRVEINIKMDEPFKVKIQMDWNTGMINQ